MEKSRLNRDVMVSIAMVTYNHEKYLAQAIESVLMQKVSFAYELIIGEDCSTDATRAVAIEYQRQYPDKIQLILHDKNVGAELNAKSVFGKCKGKYLAILEGDDYWTDANKLQKQIDYLEAHKEYIGTAHNHMTVDGSGDVIKGRDRISPKHVYTKRNAMNLELDGHSITKVYRNIFAERDQSFLDRYVECITNGDRKLNIVAGMLGDICFLEDVMAAHRYVVTNDSWSASIHHKNILDYFFYSAVESQSLIKDLFQEDCDIHEKLLILVKQALQEAIRHPNKENFAIFKKLYEDDHIDKAEFRKWCFRRKKKQ